jgi:hypothetical protein
MLLLLVFSKARLYRPFRGLGMPKVKASKSISRYTWIGVQSAISAEE